MFKLLYSLSDFTVDDLLSLSARQIQVGFVGLVVDSLISMPFQFCLYEEIVSLLLYQETQSRDSVSCFEKYLLY